MKPLVAANVSRAGVAVRTARAPKAWPRLPPRAKISIRGMSKRSSSQGGQSESVPTKLSAKTTNEWWARRERAFATLRFRQLASRRRRGRHQHRLQRRNQTCAFAVRGDRAIDLLGRFHDMDTGERQRQ